LGFPALATTSSGFAFSQGLPDYDTVVTVETMLAHVAEIAGATPLPVNADFKSCYALDAEGVATNVRRCVETGVSGLSIEDLTGDRNRPLYDLPEAVERVRAARGAIDASGSGVLLTARTECYLTGHNDPLREAIRRLTAFAEAGAEVLYAPAANPGRADIKAIVDAVKPKPVNVLMGADTGMRVADLAAMGVRRISVGSALARVGWTAVMRAARMMAEEGSFAGLSGLVSFGELNVLFDRMSKAQRL
jgi:2-methylisocitrate lyase-like PEP mutase family enzyme